ncbi:MAG: DUF262 domain-containing HNH endonuclease family protein [bacterium]
MKIDTSDVNVRTLLMSAFYIIPRFQRPYSWDNEEVAAFWNDAFESTDPDYFIGAFVVYGKSPYSKIVDGQQRLTTIIMILCILREKYKQLGFQNNADGIQAIVERSNVENDQEFVLQPESSYPFFQHRILDANSNYIAKASVSEEKQLESAYSQLNLCIESALDSVKTPQARKRRLDNIRDKLFDLKLVEIKLDTEEDAYIIFETLNARGKNLSLGDMLKAHVLGAAKPKNRQLDRPKDLWTETTEIIRDSVGDDAFDNFLLHYWLSKYEYTSHKKLFPLYKKMIKPSTAITFLEELQQYAEIYKEICTPEKVNWHSNELRLEAAMNAMNVFKVKQQMPMVLATVKLYRERKLSIKLARQVLKSIESFHFIFTAITSQRGSGGISQMYALHARRLTKCKTDKLEQGRVVAELIDKLASKLPSREDFILNFLELNYTSKRTRNKKLVQYILYNLFEHFNPSTKIDMQKMTIEHIGAESAAGKSKAIDEEHVGMLGNLLFISEAINNELGNISFDKKKSILKKKRYVLDPTISKARSWNNEKIKERTVLLAGLCYDVIWKLK